MALAALFAGAAVPASAGDGSGTDNPDLLRGAFSIACTAESLCPARDYPWTNPDTAASAPARADAPAMTVAPAAAVVEAPPAPVADLPPPASIDPVTTSAVSSPETPGDDAVIGDWQIALRGSSTWDGSGQRYAIVISPEGSLAFRRNAGEMRLAAGLELAYEPGGAVSLDGASGSLAVDHALQRDLLLRAALTLDGARDTVNAVTSPAGEEIGALSLLGSADVEIEKKAGRAGFVLGATASRRWVGDTMLVGGIASSNADRSWAGFGLKARASYKLTPILSSYVEFLADRAYYDAASGSTGASSDNWTYQATAGLTGQWRSGMTAELYGGYGYVQYDSAVLTSGGYYVLGASLTTPFARGGELTASIDTTATPTDSVAGASTQIAYAATLDGRYRINDWLTLRAALGGSWTLYPGASRDEYGMSANAGIDWLLGPHTDLTADYTFGADWTPTASGQSHEVSVGVVVHR